MIHKTIFILQKDKPLCDVWGINGNENMMEKENESIELYPFWDKYFGQSSQFSVISWHRAFCKTLIGFYGTID